MFVPHTQRNTAQGKRIFATGFAALLTIVIVSGATLVAAFGATLAGLGELESGFVSQRGGAAQAYAEGCLEETLYRLKRDTGFNGMSTVGTYGACEVSVTGSGLSRTITVDASVDEGEYHAYLTVNVALENVLYPHITITDWIEGE
jgi:hypothetical protein